MGMWMFQICMRPVICTTLIQTWKPHLSKVEIEGWDKYDADGSASTYAICDMQKPCALHASQPRTGVLKLEDNE